MVQKAEFVPFLVLVPEACATTKIEINLFRCGHKNLDAILNGVGKSEFFILNNVGKSDITVLNRARV